MGTLPIEQPSISFATPLWASVAGNIVEECLSVFSCGIPECRDWFFGSGVIHDESALSRETVETTGRLEVRNGNVIPLPNYLSILIDILI